MVNDFLYIAGQLNVENLAGNQFVNFALIGLTELPSAFVGQALMGRLGRRWVHMGCHFFTCITYAIIVALLCYQIEGTVITGLAITAKTINNIAWFIMWVQAIELYPTSLRVTGSNFAALVANIFSTFVPYVIQLVNNKAIIEYTPRPRAITRLTRLSRLIMLTRTRQSRLHIHRNTQFFIVST